jgi:MFS family permease
MSGKKTAGFGLVVFGLSMAQFIMTVDTTIMNVSVPTLVEDLGTTVGSVQTAITLYALVMASLMMVGGKLGEIYGRKKMFQTGLVIYATGSAITAIAPNIMVLIFGWSFLEGIGAALMMPAMMALISFNFKGKQRIKALGIVAAVAGAAAALGPIIGGALSTYATWRYAFVGEVIIALFTLVLSKQIIDAPVGKKTKLDYKGSLLAVVGLATIVFGVLQASTYGWIKAIKPFEIAGIEINFFGISIVPILVGIGSLIIWQLFKDQKRKLKAGKTYLVNVELLKIIPFRSGLSVVLITQMVLAGTLFVLPLFLQLVLGYNAMESGVALVPISIALIAFSVLGQKFTGKRSPIDLVRTGQVLIVAGLALLMVIISNDTTAANLIIPFLLMGAGIGLVIPFIQTIVLGSVKDSDSSQAAGLNYTYQQLGTSLGTAVIGSVLLFSLGSGIVGGLGSSTEFDTATIEENSVAISSSVEFVSNDQLNASLNGSDLSETQQEELMRVNSDARIQALRASIGVALVVSLLALAASGRIKDAMNSEKVKT